MKKRILEISKQNNLSHIGSCLGMSEVLDIVYQTKRSGDIIILDAGHSHIAHLVAMEKYEGKAIPLIHDIHCNLQDGCEVATGSLGLGICIALGKAIAKPERNVYCILSDGGCEEGSVWEALRLKTDLGIKNLKIYVNANGWDALSKVNIDLLEARLKAFDSTIKVIRTNSDFGEITKVDAHYKRL